MPSHTTLQLLSSDGAPPGPVGPNAQSYSQAAITLAGFAIAGIAIYLSRRADDRPQPTSRPVDRRRRLTSSRRPKTAVDKRRQSERVTSDNVVAALFYAMASLAICSFLYATLADEGSTGAALVAMQLYGPAMGLSVLSLFFALTLMLLEHNATREKVASYAYLVVVIAGPPVILRFLAGLAHGVSHEHSNWPLLIGTGSVGVLLLGSITITVTGLPAWPPQLQKFCDLVANRPPLPSLAAFIVVVVIAIGGAFWVDLLSTTDYMPPIWFVNVTLVISTHWQQFGS